MEKVRVGIIGCGNISAVYLQNCKKYPVFDVVACADIDIERARSRAAQFGIDKACTVDELLADQSTQFVVNLTVPKAHAEVAMRVLDAGKHVYGEKPLAIDFTDGKSILKMARDRGLRVGSAPDTVLGGGIQTCRKLIDDGWIGTPVAATAFMVGQGPESWHPDPEFFYQVGGGPMFDMGPYYLTALVTLLGPIRRVTASANVTTPERLITSEPKRGQRIKVEVPTHVTGILDFHSGAVATLITSFDVWHSTLPCIEVYGTQGTLVVPDPNTFGGPVKVRRYDANDWSDIPLTHGFADNSRGVGALDMAYAIRVGRSHRANGALALHVLETMQAFHVSSKDNIHVLLETSCDRPCPMPMEVINDPAVGDPFALCD